MVYLVLEGEHIMKKNCPAFTEEQIAKLRNNKYTYRVTPKRVVFTLEFKEYLIEQKIKHGLKIQDIFEAAGYDTSVLSAKRMRRYYQTIATEAASPEGLKTPKGLSTAEEQKIFEKKDLTKQQQKTAIKELQERVIHLEKQIEFLKKIYE